MNTYITSLIRTFVPVAVGALLTWLATSLKIVVDPSSQAGLITLCTAALSGLYYLLVRLLESKVPWLGVLLGVPAQPTYPAAPKAEADLPAVPNLTPADPDPMAVGAPAPVVASSVPGDPTAHATIVPPSTGA